MSDSIAIVKDLYAAFGCGDVPAILSRLADDVVWETEAPEAVSIAGIRHGKDETTGFFQAIGNDHADPILTIEEYLSNGDTVATFGRYAATLKATGRRVDSPIAHRWKLRDGKVLRFTGFLNSGAVLEALKA